MAEEPRPPGRRWAWFLLLYAAGVATVSVLALVLRALMPGG